MISLPATQSPRVLSLGNDPLLLRSRQLLLENAGYEVVTNVDIEETIPDFDYAFSACILGQSLPLRRRLALAGNIRKRFPQIGIVFLYYSNETFDARDVDALVPTPVDPERLITAVRRAIKKAEGRQGSTSEG